MERLDLAVKSWQIQKYMPENKNKTFLQFMSEELGNEAFEVDGNPAGPLVIFSKNGQIYRATDTNIEIIESVEDWNSHISPQIIGKTYVSTIRPEFSYTIDESGNINGYTNISKEILDHSCALGYAKVESNRIFMLVRDEEKKYGCCLDSFIAMIIVF